MNEKNTQPAVEQPAETPVQSKDDRRYSRQPAIVMGVPVILTFTLCVQGKNGPGEPDHLLVEVRREDKSPRDYYVTVGTGDKSRTMRAEKASDVFAVIADFALTQPVGAQDSKVRNERGSIVILDNAPDGEEAAWEAKAQENKRKANIKALDKEFARILEGIFNPGGPRA